jgi:hypothetical protein
MDGDEKEEEHTMGDPIFDKHLKKHRWEKQK